MIYCRSLARTLLPVEQSISLLKHKVQVVFLQLRELAYLTIFVYEGGIVKILGKGIVSFHIGEGLILYIIEPTFTADDTPSDAYLSYILLCHYLRHRKSAAIQYKVVYCCRLMFYLVKQSWCILLQLEAVGGLYQSHLFAWHDILRGDILAYGSKHLCCGQLLAFPLLHLLIGGILWWLLVAKLGNKSHSLVDMLVESCVSLQLVHILGELVLKMFQLLLVYAVGLTHKVKTQAVLHLTGFLYSLLEFSHRDKLLGIVGIHLYML